jgi:CRISPR/Cas system-associated protein endoribonuclease Cas2
VDFEKNGTIMCLPIKEIFNGYYKGNNSVYYKCIDNCKNCSNSQSCNQCHYNNYLVGNRENGNLICLPETELNIGRMTALQGQLAFHIAG